jgi:ribosomal-protein-alanine N-acetyltransferase
MTREQAHNRLDIERENRLGVQYWPMFLRETSEFVGCAGLRQWQMDPKMIEAGVHLMRSSWGLRLGEELCAQYSLMGSKRFACRRLSQAWDRTQLLEKLLERAVFAYTHNIMWGPKAIEVRMYAISAGMWRSTGAGRESA